MLLWNGYSKIFIQQCYRLFVVQVLVRIVQVFASRGVHKLTEN